MKTIVRRKNAGHKFNKHNEARVSLRLKKTTKEAIEISAKLEGLSVNSWLNQVILTALAENDDEFA